MDEEFGSQGSEGSGEISSVADSAPESNEGGTNLNPAWSDLMGVVPSQLHSQVTPHLQKWDQNFQTSLQKVHSQYEPYKPFLEQQIAPDQINYGLQLMQAIEERPAEVIAALQQAMGVDEQQGQQPVEQGQFDDNADLLSHPEIQRMNQMVEAMAQIMVQQNQTQQASQEDAALSSELDQLHEQFGDYDEEWVLTKALAHPEVPLEKLVEAYQEFEKGIISKQRQPGPRIMGAGGMAPNNQLDTKSLDDKGRRSLVADILANAAQQQ